MNVQELQELFANLLDIYSVDDNGKDIVVSLQEDWNIFKLKDPKRIKDLLIPFRKFDHYDPKKKGSASIKAVLPVMSDLSYSKLKINNGIDASLEYERVTFDENVSEEERLKVREALERYCELDTMAEVKIVERMREMV